MRPLCNMFYYNYYHHHMSFPFFFSPLFTQLLMLVLFGVSMSSSSCGFSWPSLLQPEDWVVSSRAVIITVLLILLVWEHTQKSFIWDFINISTALDVVWPLPLAIERQIHGACVHWMGPGRVLCSWKLWPTLKYSPESWDRYINIHNELGVRAELGHLIKLS